MRRALLALPLLALPVLPAAADTPAPCVPRTNVTAVPVDGRTVTMTTPATPGGSQQGGDTVKRFVLDLGSVQDAVAAPVDVTLSWTTPGTDFDVAVTDRFNFEEYGRGVERNAVTQRTSETVALPLIGHCAEFNVRASNIAASPNDVLTVKVSVGAVSTTPPAATAPLSRAGWTASGSPGQELNAPADVASNVLDGKLDTRWSSGRNMIPGDYIALDLGSAKTFSRLELDAGPSKDDYPVSYSVQVSDDGLVWSDVASGSGRTLTVVRFPAQTKRHVRLLQTGTTIPNNINYWSVAELNLFATR